MKKRLWYTEWTEKYIEGLPVGNGRLAAMMLGAPEKLRIALNHEWLWLGQNRNREYPDVSENLSEVRQALFQEDFLKGTELSNHYFAQYGGTSGRKGRIDPYEPAGDVWIEMNAVEVKNYIRSLDLDTGLAMTEFETSCGKVKQKLFASCVEGCLIVAVESENPMDMVVALNRIEDSRCMITYSKEPEGLRMKGQFLEGVAFETSLRVKTDGMWVQDECCIRVKSSTRLMFFIQIGTDAKGKVPEHEMRFPNESCFDKLFTSHVEKFHTLKGDAVLQVDVKDSGLPTNERIANFREGKDSAIPLLYFEYGRYLMASGSSGELPLNLQGKWNEDLQPPWCSDYHMNINLQMCYWFVEILGMHEVANTLFNFMENNVDYGRVLAKNLYACRGITLGFSTDVWGHPTPESQGWSVWIGAAPWIGQHMFMHWRYTKDIQFLRERCYPFLKDVATFFEDYLVEKDGELWILPSQSPENRFEGTGEWPVSIGVNSAMDVELVTELMNSVVECANVLGVDEEKQVQWRYIATHLPKLSIDKTGRLNEWDKERVEVEPEHRHLSHLYGLYPSQLFEPNSWEWKAAERSLEKRLSYGGGQTGWSRSWVGCLMARLGRSEDAWEHLLALIADFATISLLDLHPPRIFQIDGNMGGTACVCEMLMQSRRGCLRLLPALPNEWRKGHVQNFHAQDGVTVDFAWKDGELVSCELFSQEKQDLVVCFDKRKWKVTLQPGRKQRVL